LAKNASTASRRRRFVTTTFALNVNAVNLKHRLRQIETDERRRHRTISLMKNVLSVMGRCRAGNGGTSLSSEQHCIVLVLSPTLLNKNHPLIMSSDMR
jgi:hypothetical protein